MYEEVSQLVRLYAKNLLKTEAVLAAGDNLTLLNFDVDSQVANENLGISTDTWVCVAAFEEERDPKPFFDSVRKFYLATINKEVSVWGFYSEGFRSSST